MSESGVQSDAKKLATMQMDLADAQTAYNGGNYAAVVQYLEGYYCIQRGTRIALQDTR
jgi:hypothetical protein